MISNQGASTMFPDEEAAFIKPSASDLALLAQANAELKKDDPESIKEFSKKILSDLQKANPRTLFKLCVNPANADFKEICADEKLPHSEVWAKFLASRKFPGFVCQSLDKSETCTLLDQFIAGYLWTEYKHKKAEAEQNIDNKAKHRDTLSFAVYLLNHCCDHKHLNALKERCEFYSSIIQANDVPAEYKIMVDDLLNTDLKTLGNLYWTVGCLQASRILLNLSIYFSNNDLDPENTKAKMALEYYYRAVELNEYNNLPDNKKAVQAICQERNLIVLFDDPWKTFEEDILKSLDRSIHDKDDIKLKIRNEIEHKIRYRPGTPTRDTTLFQMGGSRK